MPGGKKNRIPPLQEILDRVWCYYCERDFDDLRVLQDHQRAKHFKCSHCNRRLNTIGGLRVHTEQVHKTAITEVDNCTIPDRNSIHVEVFGMTGIPEDVLENHKRNVTEEYFRRCREWEEKTGNPIQGENPRKRTRTEEPGGDVKARVKAIKARKAAQREGVNESHSEEAAQDHDHSVAQQERDTLEGPSATPTPVLGYGAGLMPYSLAFSPPGQIGRGSPHPYESPQSNIYGHQMQHENGANAFHSPATPYNGYSPATATSYPIYPNASGIPQRPTTLSTTPLPASVNLPNRPSFSAPLPSKADMVKMHAGSFMLGDRKNGSGERDGPLEGQDVDELIREELEKKGRLRDGQNGENVNILTEKKQYENFTAADAATSTELTANNSENGATMPGSAEPFVNGANAIHGQMTAPNDSSNGYSSSDVGGKVKSGLNIENTGNVEAVTEQTGSAVDKSQEPVTATTAVDFTQTAKKPSNQNLRKAQSKKVMVWTDNATSPEEKKAKATRYQTREVSG